MSTGRLGPGYDALRASSKEKLKKGMDYMDSSGQSPPPSARRKRRNLLVDIPTTLGQESCRPMYHRLSSIGVVRSSCYQPQN